MINFANFKFTFKRKEHPNLIRFKQVTSELPLELQLKIAKDVLETSISPNRLVHFVKKSPFLKNALVLLLSETTFTFQYDVGEKQFDLQKLENRNLRLKSRWLNESICINKPLLEFIEQNDIHVYQIEFPRSTWARTVSEPLHRLINHSSNISLKTHSIGCITRNDMWLDKISKLTLRMDNLPDACYIHDSKWPNLQHLNLIIPSSHSNKYELLAVNLVHFLKPCYSVTLIFIVTQPWFTYENMLVIHDRLVAQNPNLNVKLSMRDNEQSPIDLYFYWTMYPTKLDCLSDSLTSLSLSFKYFGVPDGEVDLDGLHEFHRLYKLTLIGPNCESPNYNIKINAPSLKHLTLKRFHLPVNTDNTLSLNLTSCQKLLCFTCEDVHLQPCVFTKLPNSVTCISLNYCNFLYNSLFQLPGNLTILDLKLWADQTIPNFVNLSELQQLKKINCSGEGLPSKRFIRKLEKVKGRNLFTIAKNVYTAK
ncbi:unnamed protein product [Ambrosiozyma monospora]|uniref:Unnamed protein product n=1 Tax=Ambrosiozyma monospora TaxID=43982 RepID=A0ACB5SWX8_AMBMO|nr:unnamed protein product [Ambrosiozyma monospora]